MTNPIWRKLLKYGIPAAVTTAATGYKMYQRHQKIRAYNKKYIYPVKAEARKWEIFIGQLNGASEDLRKYMQVYYPSTTSNKEKVEKDKLVYHHKPEPEKAKKLLEKAATQITSAKETPNKKDLISVVEELSAELEITKDYGNIRQEISQIVDEAKKTASEYNYQVSKLEKEREFKIRLI